MLASSAYSTLFWLRAGLRQSPTWRLTPAGLDPHRLHLPFMGKETSFAAQPMEPTLKYLSQQSRNVPTHRTRIGLPQGLTSTPVLKNVVLLTFHPQAANGIKQSTFLAQLPPHWALHCISGSVYSSAVVGALFICGYSDCNKSTHKSNPAPQTSGNL